MNRKFTGGISLLGGVCGVILLASHTIELNQDDYCSNVDSQQYQASLSADHPLNRCASDRTNNVSWSNWFAGKSAGHQFHYLDLLELLSRQSDNHSVQNNGSR